MGKGDGSAVQRDKEKKRKKGRHSRYRPGSMGPLGMASLPELELGKLTTLVALARHGGLPERIRPIQLRPSGGVAAA